MGQWDIIVPTEARNLIANPSFENAVDLDPDTDNAFSMARHGYFSSNGGAVIEQVAPQPDASALWPVPAGSRCMWWLSDGTTSQWVEYRMNFRPDRPAGFNGAPVFVFSVFMLTQVTTMTIRLQVLNGATILAQSAAVASTADKTWKRFFVPVSLSFSTTYDLRLRVLITGANAAAMADSFMDGWQFEQVQGNSVAWQIPSTYFDGDSSGCAWEGAPHNSISYRPKAVGGGVRFDLETVGLTVVQSQAGSGFAPVENATVEYAQGDGAFFQRAGRKPRYLTLKSWQAPGDGLESLFTSRLALGQLFPPGQPVQFIRKGGTRELQITAYYDSGFTFDGTLGNAAESTPIRFLCPDPFWYDVNQGESLLPQINPIVSSPLTGSGYMTRVPGGFPDNFGAIIKSWGVDSALNGTVWVLAIHPLTSELWAGGDFTTSYDINGLNPLTCNRIARFDTGQRRWVPVTTAGVDNTVFAIEFDPTGTVYIGGSFTKKFAWITKGSAGYTLTTGDTPNDTVGAIAYAYNGLLYVAGGFTASTSVGTLRRIAAFNPITKVFSEIGGGLNGQVYDLMVTRDNTVWAAGSFTAKGDGTGTLRRLMNFNPGEHLFYEVEGLNDAAIALGQKADNTVVVVGNFTATVGGKTLKYIAQHNGLELRPVAGGLDSPGQTLGIDPQDRLWISQSSNTINGMDLPGVGQSTVIYDGSSFRPIDVLNLSTGYISTIIFRPNGQVYVGFSAAINPYVGGTTRAHSLSTAESVPTLVVRGPLALFSLTNETTGDTVTFKNLNVQQGEMIYLDFAKPLRQVWSSMRGALSDVLVSGGTPNGFALAPGENRLSLMSSNLAQTGLTVTLAYLVWRPRHESIDSVMYGKPVLY